MNTPPIDHRPIADMLDEGVTAVAKHLVGFAVRRGVQPEVAEGLAALAIIDVLRDANISHTLLSHVAYNIDLIAGASQ